MLPDVTLQNILSLNYNLVALYRRWMDLPIVTRMAVVAYMHLDKTPDNQLQYGVKVGEAIQNEPQKTPDDLKAYLQVAHELVQRQEYEVKIDV